MCGFFGVYDFNGLTSLDYADIQKSTNQTKYRGPDDSGFYKDERCSIGFNRLSIVDLNSPSQPFINNSKDLVLVCNGEIYNYKDLRKELENEFFFKTQTDTEVLLHGYQKWGDNLWKKTKGMFSVAIYDKKKEEIKLVRDHAGIKPLHYLIKNNKIYFASDLKSFFFIKNIKPEIRKESILSYLSFRYVLGENTFYKNIKDIMPAQILTFKKNILNKSFYWSLKNNFIKNINEKNAIEELDYKLKEAVNSHLIGNVKIGVFVSGGLDSSLIAHYMNKQGSQLEGFGASVKEAGYDEIKYMKKISNDEKIKLNITEINKNNFISNIDNIIKFKSEPASIPHETGFYLMSKSMSSKIKVVLSGEGADELFGGYGRLFQSPADYYKKKINLFYKDKEIDHFLKRYCIFKDVDKKKYLNLETFNFKIHDEESVNYLENVFMEVKHKNYFEKMYYIMFKVHLTNMLYRLDRMTMASSIEARVPFLDRDLIEFIYSLPSCMKIRWKNKFSKIFSYFGNSESISEKLDIPKYILKKVAEGKIDKEIIYRKKQPFPFPLDNWMKKELGEYAKDNLLKKNSLIHEFLNIENLNKKFETKDFNSPEDLDGKRIWMLLNLEMWIKKVNSFE